MAMSTVSVSTDKSAPWRSFWPTRKAGMAMNDTSEVPMKAWRDDITLTVLTVDASQSKALCAQFRLVEAAVT